MMQGKIDTFNSVIKSQWLVGIVLVAIVVWGGWLRFSCLDCQSIWIDESFSILAAEKIVESGSPLLDSGRVYSRSKPHVYLTSFLYNIAGPNLMVLRSQSVFFGTAVILLIFFLTRNMYGELAPALIAALLLCTSYLEIAWSRQVRMYIELQFFYYLTLLLWHRYIFLNKKSLIYLCLMLFGLTLTISIHASGILIAIPMTLMLFFSDNIKKFFNRKSAVFIGLVILFFMAYIFYSVFERSIRSGTYFVGIDRVVTLLDHYITFMIASNNFVFISSLAIFFISIIRFDKQDLVVCLSVLLSIFAICSQNVVLMRGLFFLLPLFIILTARLICFIFIYGRKILFKFIKRNLYKDFSYGVLIITFLLIMLSRYGVIGNSFIFFPRDEYFLEFDSYFDKLNSWDYTPQPDFNSAYEFIELNKKEGDIFLVAHSAIHQWYLPDSETYWLGFLFINKARRQTFYLENSPGSQVEGYMDLPILSTFEELKNILNTNHGFVIIDHFSMSTDVPRPVVKYLLEKAPVEYTSELGRDMPWNRIWVGRF